MNTSMWESMDPAELGRRLQQARKKSGLTQEQAAEVIGVARTTLTAIEKGERRIKSGELIKLSHAYGRQVNELLRVAPVAEPFQVQFRSLSFDAKGGAPDVQQSINLFEDLCRYYLALEQITGMPMPKKYPGELQLAGLPVEQAAESAAEEERTRLGLGDGPIPALREVLEQEIGFRVFYIAIKPSTVSEMYFYSDDVGACLAINKLHPEERRRWSLAHGYAHFLFKRRAPEVHVEGSYRRVPEVERFADEFAKCFLMPAQGIRRRFTDQYRAKGGITMADLLVLAHYYGVSLQALAFRLEETRLIPSGTWARIKSSDFHVREAQEQLGLDGLPVDNEMFPKRYQYLALDALDRELITEGQFAQYLQLDRLEARNRAEVLRQELGDQRGGLDNGLTRKLDL